LTPTDQVLNASFYVYGGRRSSRKQAWNAALHIDVLFACAGIRADARPIAGERLRHALIGLADSCALRIELRIVLVGSGQRRLDLLGRRGIGRAICHYDRRTHDCAYDAPHPHPRR
jgi:hypothetical protein